MNRMSEKEFANKYCGKCGTQWCEGAGTEFADGCNYYLKYVLGLEFYTEDDDKEICVKIERIVKDANASYEENINRLQRIGLLDKSGRSREEAVKAAKEQMEKGKKAEMESYELIYKDMPISMEEVYADLEESRKCFERGEYQDFDDAIEDIKKKYNL